jgi:HK97 gp10 family phage protein
MIKYTSDQWAKALGKLSNDVRGRVLKEAAQAGGSVIETHAKLNVKKNFNQLTGNLAASIVVNVVKSEANRVVVEVGPSNVEYARLQEMGGVVKARHVKALHWVDEAGGHHVAKAVTIPARPYLRPAVEENESEIMDAVGTVLTIQIEKAIG